jgi:hypothetical protein
MAAHPQTQRMLFVTDEEPGVAGFERGPLGGPGAPVFFLSAVAAGKSVASMMATV